MMKPITIKNYKELISHIKKLRKDFNKVVFRGQVKYYNGNIIPSITRKSHHENDKQRIWNLATIEGLGKLLIEYNKWRKSYFNKNKDSQANSNQVSNENKTAIYLESIIQAILQHYGARSTYIDVTSSIDIALWFAHNTYEIYEAPFLPADVPHIIQKLSPFAPMPVFDIASYSPAYKKLKNVYGYLFVLAPSIPNANQALKHGDFIDISAFSMALRMKNQKASLIYADINQDGGNLKSILKVVFRFKLPLRGLPHTVKKKEAIKLFPTPDKDIMYKEILSSTPFCEDLDNPYRQLRLLRIPEYYNSIDKFYTSKSWNSFRSCDLYLQPGYFFPLLASSRHVSLECTLSDTKYHISDAVPIITSAPSVHMVADIPDDEFIFTIGESHRSIFLEYTPLQLALPLTKEHFSVSFYQKNTITTHVCDWPNVRGVWLICYEKKFWCRIFGAHSNTSLSEINISMGHSFSFIKGKGLQVLNTEPIKNDQEEYHIKVECLALKHALGLFTSLLNGKRKIIESQLNRYLILE